MSQLKPLSFNAAESLKTLAMSAGFAAFVFPYGINFKNRNYAVQIVTPGIVEFESYEFFESLAKVTGKVWNYGVQNIIGGIIISLSNVEFT